MWGNFRKVKSPTSREIFHDTSMIMKKRYEVGEQNVIKTYAEAVAKNGLNEEQKQLHQYYSFKLASIRNLYMSRFLKEHDAVRSELKERMAILFSQAHLCCLAGEYKELSKVLFELAKLDHQFRDLCLRYGGD